MMDYLYYPNTKAVPSPQPFVNKVNGSIYNKHISSSTTTTTAQCCYHSSSSSNAYQGNSRLKYKIAKDDDVLTSSMKSTSQSPHKRNKSALTYINATNDSCSSINKRKSNVSFIKTSKLNFDRIKNASFYNNSTNSNSNNNHHHQQQQQQPLSSKRESCSKRYFNSTNINNSNWNYTERVHYNDNAVNNHNDCGAKYNKIKPTVNVNVNKSLHYGVRKNCLSKGREMPLPKHNVNDNSCSCSNSSSSMIINHKYNYKQYIYENEQHKNDNDDDVVNGLDSVNGNSNKQHKSDVNDKDTNSSTSNSSGHRTVIGYTRNTTRNGMNGSNSHINMNNSSISSCNNYSQCIKQQQQQQQHIHHCKDGSISTTTCEDSKIHLHNNNNNNTHNKQSSHDMITFTAKIDSIEDAHINFVKMIQDTKKLCIQKEQSLIVVDTDDIYID